MPDETSPRSSGAPPSGGRDGGGSGNSSPLQARAAFFTHWSWESVVGINRGTCERGGAQHGINSETGSACESRWEESRAETLTLADALHHLRDFHRRAPFLFFNGNTFAAIGRQLVRVIFSDLPTARQREVVSAVAHYIAGVLDWEAMVQVVESLCAAADMVSGTRVKTLRGSTHGEVLRVLDDGRVVWRTDGGTELTALPETLTLE